MRVPVHQRKPYAWRWTAALAGLAVLAVFMAVWLAGEPEQHPVQAATFTVNSLNDVDDGACNSTHCSLREAIIAANAAGADTISFGSLSGTITLTVALPNITDNDTTIDGNGNVTVSGAGAVGNCFTVTSSGNTIRDLLITGCTAAGIALPGPGDANAIRGNTIFGNGSGISIAAGADGNTIGGTTTANRNIIRENTGAGVSIGSDGNTIQGNCIGTTATCSVAAPNGGDGVSINGSNNTVGGTASGAGNVIAFNGGDGVDIGAGTNNIVTRNVMFLNTGQGINGVAAAPGLLAGCADAGGGNVSCTGVASNPGDIVEVYRASVEGLDVEGDLFLCTAVAGGAGAWGCTFPNPGGGSATATERTPGGNTSEFSGAVSIPAGPVATDTPTPTNTPSVTNTPTVTSTPPTATPTRTVTPGGPTATATVGATESLTLVGGTCNPVASTYPDNTAITTIAGAVSPSGILISIWWFNPSAGMWLGYSPQFPQASDLTEVDRLEAIFICVSSAGSWSRPLI